MLELAHIFVVKRQLFLILLKVSAANQDFAHHFQQLQVYMLGQLLLITLNQLHPFQQLLITERNGLHHLEQRRAKALLSTHFQDMLKTLDSLKHHLA